jgi:cell division protein ZapA
MSQAEDVAPITLRIMDHDYQVVCPKSEHGELTAAAVYLNDQLTEILNAGKIQGTERIVVMVALNISYELLKCRRELDELDGATGHQVQRLLNKVETALSKSS